MKVNKHAMKPGMTIISVVLCLLLLLGGFPAMAAEREPSEEPSSEQTAEPLGEQTAEPEAMPETEPSDEPSDEPSEEPIEGPLPLWTEDSTAREELISYMEAVTDEDSSDYIPVNRRVAVFDLDGTLFCETDPNYFDYCLLKYRVLDDPDYVDQASDFERVVALKIREQNETGASFEGLEVDHGRAVASAFAGMTPEEFSAYIQEFKKQPMPTYDGMNRGDGWYLPMLQVVEYLKDNDFTVYIVSGTDRFIVRGIVEGSPLDLPPWQIIGSDETLVATDQGDTDGLSYVYDEDDALVLGGDFVVKNLKMNKVTVIAQEIGVQPVLSFGNSTGDSSMASYVTSGNPYRSLAFMLCCDDTERENGNVEKANKMFDLCGTYGWVPVSMKNDWTTIYGDDVTYLGVPHATEAETAGSTRDVVVLFTSDVHCGVDQNFGYVGLQAVKDAMEAAGNYVLLVDDGDSIQGEPMGTMTRGEASIQLMNALGYDVAIPGNHEFDYGVDRFLELTELAEYPYISCNFNREGERIFEPYVIKEVDGVKIAFVGVTTPKTLTSSTPTYFQDEDGNYIYGFLQDETGEAVYSAVQQAVDDARAEGAAYVIVLGHCGNETECEPWTYADIIENTTGIDAFLDGHSHDTDKVVMKNRDGEDVVRQACGTKMYGIGWLRISAEDGSVDTGLYTWNNDIPAPELLGIENRMAAEVENAVGELNEKLGEVVAHTAADLVINDPYVTDDDGNPIRIVRRAETNLGDLCADAYLDQSGADIAFVNGGGVRTSIAAGDITMNDILKVAPFGNMLTVIEVTGQQVLDALEWGARSVPGESGGFPQVAGLTYEIHTYLDSACTEDEDGMFTGVNGEYRVKNVMVGGEPLDLEKTYTLASVNYLLREHGDGYTMFDDSPVLQDAVKLDNQVLIDYITGTLGGVVGEDYSDPYGQGRIVAVESPDEAAGVQVETVETDSFSMDYVRFGQGEKTLVILPGLSVQSVMGSADAIAEAYDLFTEDYTVYLFDRRKELPDAYSVYDMARDTAEAIQELGLEPVSLMGVSQGGMMAMDIAIRNPELVEKLVLGSTSACVTEEQYETMDAWVRLAEDGNAEGLYLAFGEALYPEEMFDESAELLIEAAKTVTAEELERFIILSEGTQGFDVSDDLVKIACPVLLIGSLDDGVLGADATSQIAERLDGRPDFELYMYDGYGHAAYDTAPDYKERVLDFLASGSED